MREIRARFCFDAGYANLEDARGAQIAWERALERCLETEAVVLWTDHRLTDQLILLKVLEWLSQKRSRTGVISLISVGRYPGIDNFISLGQLNTHQLASLVDRRLRVTDAQFSVARKAWDAFCSPDPRNIERIVISDTSPLPFLKNALRRHLEQYPSSPNGLSRTEHRVLSILHQYGTTTAARLFFAVQRSEELLFMGDTSFYRLLIDMTSLENPLVTTGDSAGLKLGVRNQVFKTWTNSPVGITEMGVRVLNGHEDHIRLNGIDRWLGGVHLRGDDSAWRWDREASRLMAAA